MKQLIRPDAPHPFNCNVTKRKYYEDLFDSKGSNVKNRWNAIRITLSEISNHHCAYCGKKAKITVDHFLPKNKNDAPYLAYCWENLIPACHDCNQRKSSFFPHPLRSKQIIESCALGVVPHDHLYDKVSIMDLAKDDRLIDPTFDQVDQHLTLNLDFHYYKAHSSIGKKTKELFLGEKFEENLEKISNLAKNLVIDQSSPATFESIVVLTGEEFYLRAYYEYWLQEYAAGLMR